MRILHLVSCGGWSSDVHWAAEVTRELQHRGHAATLVCRRGTEERVIARARQAGVAGIETLTLRSGVKPRADVTDLRWLLAKLPDTDVLHVHRSKEHWLAALANRLSAERKPLVRTRHIVQAIRPHPLNRWLYRHATDAVVAVTEAIRRQYVAAGLVAPERIVTLQGGVDTRRFHPGVCGREFRRSLGIPDPVAIVAMASNFRIMKGHSVLLEALRRLVATDRPVHLLLVGRGPTEGRVRDEINRMGLGEHVTIAGFLHDLPQALAACDVAVYASNESEGMSRVVFEYLALGKPLVATRVGVVPEVLRDGQTALLVPAEEPEALASAIGKLVDEPARRRSLGRAGAALIEERLSSSRVSERLLALYAETRALSPFIESRTRRI